MHNNIDIIELEFGGVGLCSIRLTLIAGVYQAHIDHIELGFGGVGACPRLTLVSVCPRAGVLVVPGACATLTLISVCHRAGVW